jgi:hypothetical protein
MALVINDRVKETSTTTGTGAIALAGVVSGFETLQQALVIIMKLTMLFLILVQLNGKLEEEL